jgi:hypothetical protein
MTRPRYIVWNDNKHFWLRETLAEALDTVTWLKNELGMKAQIYEPLAATACERIVKEETPPCPTN